MSECIFCNIVKGQIPAQVVYENDGSNVQLVGDPYSVNVCHVVNIKARKGYDKTELEKVKEFYKENAESINRGFANEAKKHAGELHQKTGKALKDYIDMPYIID